MTDPSASGTGVPGGRGGRPLARVGVLLSGRGSNFLALHAAMERGEVPARVVLVVSNVLEAPGIERARALGLETLVLPHAESRDRRSHELRVAEALERAEVQWVCLAGYMRVLSADFVSRFPRRILNIHPSLLPSFPGLDVQRQVLDHGVKVAGCTVHLVDDSLDGGPIVEQRVVAVLDDDTPDSLAARILVEEHKAYPSALGRLLTTPWCLNGRRVVFTARLKLPSGG